MPVGCGRCRCDPGKPCRCAAVWETGRVFGCRRHLGCAEAALRPRVPSRLPPKSDANARLVGLGSPRRPRRGSAHRLGFHPSGPSTCSTALERFAPGGWSDSLHFCHLRGGALERFAPGVERIAPGRWGDSLHHLRGVCDAAKARNASLARGKQQFPCFSRSPPQFGTADAFAFIQRNVAKGITPVATAAAGDRPAVGLAAACCNTFHRWRRQRGCLAASARASCAWRFVH